MNSICRDLKTSDSHKEAVLLGRGDLNLPDINWFLQSIEGIWNSVTINQRFLSCVHHFALEQMVYFQTRLNATLNLFMTIIPFLVDKCRPAPGVGDNDIVLVTFFASVRRSRPIQHKIYLRNMANPKTIKEECRILTNKFLAGFNIIHTVEDIWVYIKTSFLG